MPTHITVRPARAPQKAFGITLPLLGDRFFKAFQESFPKESSFGIIPYLKVLFKD